MWKGRPASVKHLKVFGRKFFIKRNHKNIGNFDSHADEAILLGYFALSKGYKCYNKWTERIEYFIDVIVDETSSQPGSSKRNMNSDNEENPYMRFVDLEETKLDNEEEESHTTQRPKEPSRYVQKEHPMS